MPDYYGIKNVATQEKMIVGGDNLNSVPCGLYTFWVSASKNNNEEWGIEPENAWASALKCKACDGTGGHEELSGGHKRYCEECFGEGIDPVLLSKFEKEEGIWNSSTTSPHLLGNCNDCWDAYSAAKRNQSN